MKVLFSNNKKKVIGCNKNNFCTTIWIIYASEFEVLVMCCIIKHSVQLFIPYTIFVLQSKRVF